MRPQLSGQLCDQRTGHVFTHIRQGVRGQKAIGIVGVKAGDVGGKILIRQVKMVTQSDLGQGLQDKGPITRAIALRRTALQTFSNSLPLAVQGGDVRHQDLLTMGSEGPHIRCTVREFTKGPPRGFDTNVRYRMPGQEPDNDSPGSPIGLAVEENPPGRQTAGLTEGGQFESPSAVVRILG